MNQIIICRLFWIKAIAHNFYQSIQTLGGKVENGKLVSPDAKSLAFS
ncbi:hypothetical protein PN458_05630 [Nodularia spumigena CS-336/02]|nr:hypothetical protein [Nodularia spumigena]MDB9358055.1 hypothetical protein [Nodularia spumigena CS-587/03]MDB9399499.1 hypothetical protein [Microcystis aeruginosa CS-567/02-A1]MDB9339963.1 hypothetical protein [Nodularia spumigena CS-589/07]MDB9348292.1 hypothetical protein [Nodularia spumigena CS-588/01]MDB9354646.1 hypothetical protein [Nodularia spumigena CS-588/05]